MGWQKKNKFSEYKSSHNILAIRLDSKLMVLDIDNVDDWKAFLLYHGHDISEFEDIPHDSTRNHGIHYYFKSNQNFSKTMIKFLDLNGRKLDINIQQLTKQMKTEKQNRKNLELTLYKEFKKSGLNSFDLDKFRIYLYDEPCPRLMVYRIKS
jgi:hypothetical protein